MGMWSAQCNFSPLFFTFLDFHVHACLSVSRFLRSLFKLDSRPIGRHLVPVWTLTMGRKTPRKNVVPKLSVMKMDINDVQDDIDFLKSVAYPHIWVSFWHFVAQQAKRNHGRKPGFSPRNKTSTWYPSQKDSTVARKVDITCRMS